MKRTLLFLPLLCAGCATSQTGDPPELIPDVADPLAQVETAPVEAPAAEPVADPAPEAPPVRPAPVPEQEKVPTIVWIKLAQADRLFKEGRFAEAAEACAKALAVDSENVLAHVRLGSALYAMGLPEEAVGHWRRAVEIDPTHPEAVEAAEFLSAHFKKRGGR